MRVVNRSSFMLLMLLIILSVQTSSQTSISKKNKPDFNFKPPVFENITLVDGLPENSVGSILQDYLGYLWIGTQNGLVRYDGYSMKVFDLERDSINNLSTYDLVIYEDKNRTLWVGTLNGLNRFDRLSESFILYKYNADDTTTVNSNLIRSFFEDNSGRFWVGTQKGLNLFDRNKGIFTRYYFENLSASVLPKQNYLPVNTIIEDPLTEDLLIGTEVKGVWKFSIKERIFTKYNDSNLDEKIGCIQAFYKARNGSIWMASANTLSSLTPQKKAFEFYIDFPTTGDEQNVIFTNPIGSVVEDKEGLIWAGFFKGEKGVFCLNPATGDLQQYNLFPDKPGQARYNKILSLYVDRSGIIWIGTWLNGIMKFDKRKNQFRVLCSDPDFLPACLSNSLVYSVTYDPEGFIWFYTKRALDRFDIKTSTYKHYLKDEECLTKFAYMGLQDKSGYIWLGTSNCGLIRFNPTDETYRYFFNDPRDSANLVNKQIKILFLDHLGILWIGTDGFGLYKFDIKNNKTTIFKNDPKDSSSLRNDQVITIYEDSFGALWVGTNFGGLNKFDRDTEKFTYCGFNTVMIMYEDRLGNFWVGDYLAALNLFDREKGVVKANYGKKAGLIYQNILGIMEDDHDNLWIATQIGLSKFNLKTRTFRNYTKGSGLPQWSTDESFCFVDPDGRMYINTSEGEVVFHPDSIRDDPTPPQVIISGISLFNRPNEKLSDKGFVPGLKEINLPYDQNDLRFDFVGFHFSSPEKNRYKYILENFDNDWVDAGDQTYATYTNLNPGKYIFRVKASNKDGIWNETGVSIALIINPPFWATTWAYLLYVILAGCVIYSAWKAQVKRIHNRNEYEMSRFEAQKLLEVDQIKSRFFTNISHEFRTPLTLILGPVKQLLQKTKDPGTKENLDIIHRNAKKLRNLVDELLDISKIEAGEMKLKTCPQNLVSAVKEILSPFHTFAERKDITLNFNYDENEIITYFDRDKTDKILNNIISNAFKFTPEGGKIDVGVRRGDNSADVSITDSGIGIPQDQMDKIFNRFYQVDGSHTREHEGTGIGLSLTKELVELHKGKIEVKSQEGKGSTFIVRFPLGREHLKPEEISETVVINKEQKSEQKLEESIFIKHEYTADYPDKAELPLLLIIEDNADVRFYIKSNLKQDYQVTEAGDGEEGWSKSIEHIPDLIISDVMMPKMDGFKLCERLKNDERTSHIPIILLTAKAAKEDKLEGYQIGADDYIMKPFEPDELRARIKNLLEQRKRLHEHFQKNGLFELTLTNITPVDKKFIQKVYETVNDHISEASLNLDTFAAQLNVSKSLLHKKIVSLTGESPGELIRRVRLQKAAELIEKKFGNLSEIAFEVGFNNPSYFSECFKKQFGIVPSQYHKDSKKSN